MNLLQADHIKLFSNLKEINDGFRIPDEAYVHGKDFSCFESLGGDLYYSNYWYGDYAGAKDFAEKLAQYLKQEYEKIVPENDRYDFYGMVMLWNLGDKSVVGSINLEADLSGLGDEDYMPVELKKSVKKNKLKLLLDDGNDNSALDLLFSEVSKKAKKELLLCVAESYKNDYINMAKEEGINIQES